MPDSREQREVLRNRRQSTRIATSAIKSAMQDVSAPERSRLPNMGLKKSRAVTTVGDVEVQARATTPAISFTVHPSGKLITGLRGVRATARHEVGHFTIPGNSETQHAALRATSSGASPQTGTQLRQARLAGFETPQRRLVRRKKLQGTGAATSIARAPTIRGGSLRAAHHSPSEKRRKDARALSNKMQFRLRKAGRDF